MISIAVSLPVFLYAGLATGSCNSGLRDSGSGVQGFRHSGFRDEGKFRVSSGLSALHLGLDVRVEGSEFRSLEFRVFYSEFW